MPVSSVERPVSALRQRMLEDMAMRGLRSHTQHDYIRFVRSFAGFLGRSPDTAQAEDIRRFQVHQREIGYSRPPSTARSQRCASCSAQRSTGRICRGAWSWRAFHANCQRC